VSQESLWLCDGDSSGNEEGVHQPSEAGTQSREGQETKKIQCVLEWTVDCKCEIAIAL
jgi:hypothetical protein